MVVPASCQKFLNDAKSLEAQITKIQSSPGYIQGPDDPHPGKPDPESLAAVKALEKKIAADISSFQACLVKNVKPFPLRITVSSIGCVVGTSEIGADEPYVIVTSCDLSTAIPGVECTLYGPVSMGSGQAKNPMGQPFWFIDHQSAKIISDPTQAIFIVSLMENDNGSPSGARAFVKGLVIASLLASTALTRAGRVQQLLADIDSALAFPTGFPNLDEQIGASQELVLSTLDLVLPLLGPHTIPLTFAGDGQFTVTCMITEGIVFAAV